MAWDREKRPMPDDVKKKISDKLKGGGSLYKHGQSRTPLYRKWEAAKGRCDNVRNARYSSYGGRGIRMRWRTFESFRDDMGESFEQHVALHGAADTTLERIDNNGDYDKGNCRWATRREQARNTRRNRVFALSEIVEAVGLNYGLVITRLRRGSSLADAIRAHTGCESCGGKGYASYLNTTVGHDTDTDIGSPGGSHSRTTNEMKFCVCDRGEQLAEFVGRAEKQAASQALFHYRADLMAENLVSYDADGSNCVWDYDGIGRMVVGDEDD